MRKIRKVSLNPFKHNVFEVYTENLEAVAGDNVLENFVVKANSDADYAAKEIKNYPKVIREFVWRVVFNSKMSTLIKMIGTENIYIS